MERIAVIIKKKCSGSETGLSTVHFEPSPEPVEVEKSLAAVFIEQGWAALPVKGKAPGPEVKKVVEPEVKKVVKPESVKSLKDDE